MRKIWYYQILFCMYAACASVEAPIDFYLNTKDIPMDFCPKSASCKIEKWNKVHTVLFDSAEQSGRITFVDKKLRTVTLLRPKDTTLASQWENHINQKIGKSLVREDGIIEGTDFVKHKNRLISNDQKIVIETDDKGVFQQVHLSK